MCVQVRLSERVHKHTKTVYDAMHSIKCGFHKRINHDNTLAGQCETNVCLENRVTKLLASKATILAQNGLLLVSKLRPARK